MVVGTLAVGWKGGVLSSSRLLHIKLVGSGTKTSIFKYKKVTKNQIGPHNTFGACIKQDKVQKGHYISHWIMHQISLNAKRSPHITLAMWHICSTYVAAWLNMLDDPT